MNIGGQIADPVLFDEKLFIVEYWSGHPGAFLLDIGGKKPPKLLWTNRETSSNNGSPVVIDGYIYVCQDGIQSGSGSLRCLDAENGEILLLCEGKIYCRSSSGDLVCIDVSG